MPISRRTLLASSAALGAASLVAAAAAEQEPTALLGTVEPAGEVRLPPLHEDSEVEGGVPNRDAPAKRLGVAVVGLGHLALENIVPAFGSAKHVRLAALVSGERPKALAVAAQAGLDPRHVYDYATFDRIRDDADVDLVYVVLPNALHAEYVVRAAAAGKHVLCEKPMATTAADCERMIAACRRAGRKLQIAYRLQYDATHREAIALSRGGAYGAIRLIEAVNGQNDRANGQWRQIESLAGGGSLPDVGLYCLSAFRYITGEEPLEVTGRTTQPEGDPRFREIEDVCQFTMRFPSGVFATGTSAYSLHESRRLRVNAADGWIGMDPAFSYDNLALEIGKRAGDANGTEQRRFGHTDQFAVEMDAFAQSIRRDLVPHTPGEEGLADQRIIEAIYASAHDGGRPVVTRPPAPVSAGPLDVTRGPFPPTAAG